MDTGEALGSRDALGALTRGRSSGEGTFFIYGGVFHWQNHIQ